MIRAVEAAHRKLQDAETPSNEYLAVKVEECENNEPLAAMLEEITSKQDTTIRLRCSLRWIALATSELSRRRTREGYPRTLKI